MAQHLRLEKSGIRAVKIDTRDEGFENESKDCFVKAIQAVTGVPYRDAHAYVCKRFDRKPRRGTHKVADRMLDIATKAEYIYGFRAFHHTAPVRFATYCGSPRFRFATLSQFVRSHPAGRWLLWSRNHAFAVIDGVVHDSGAAGARTQVTGVYELRLSSEVEACDILPVNQGGF
jgi:hypothetical protein